MTLRMWHVIGIVMFLGALGTIVAVDHRFKAETSHVSDDGAQVLTITENGFLHKRRSLFLVCTRTTKAHFVAKARLAERNWLRPSSVANKATIIVSDEARSRDFPKNLLFKADTRMKLVSTGWVDTLESDELQDSTLDGIAASVARQGAHVISIGTMERGVFFDLTSRSDKIQWFASTCRSRQSDSRFGGLNG